MAHVIAVAGKGGVGKTTLCGMLIQYLCEKGKGPILAVDADANSNLNEVLGVKVETTLGDVREEIPATVVINDKVYKVTTIDKNAFSGNKEITDVIFGNNVTTIGKYAFSQCPNLRNIRFGSRVKRIGSNAFAQCTKLRNFILPASVRHRF